MDIELTQEQIDALPSRYVHKKSHLPYEMAKEAVNSLAPHVTSANKYRKWIKETKSYYMPIHPERVYSNFSWSEFLGAPPQPNFVEYVVETRRKRANYLSLWDAVKWSQRYCRENGIDTREKWKIAYDSGQIPDNIPRLPWMTWKGEYPGSDVWFGKTVSGIQEGNKHITPVLTLLHPVKVPQNVVQLVSWPDGVSDLRDKWRKQSDFDQIIGSWVYERDLMPEVERILSEVGFSDGERWTIPNLNQLTWELNSLLEMVRLR